MIKRVLIAPGILSFLYIIFSASNLKYSNKGLIGDLDAPNSIRRSLYDGAIDMFWAGLVVLSAYLIATLFGWSDGKNMDVGIIKGSVVSMIPLSILIFAFIIYAPRKIRETKQDQNIITKMVMEKLIAQRANLILVTSCH